MCNDCKVNEAARPSNSSIAYGVYESGGVVKAEVTDTAFDAMHVITRLCEKADMKTISLEGIWENTLLENSYRGKAKVNHADGDKFVEDIGKEFARGKALDKYHRAFDKKLRAMLLDARVLVATIEHYCNKKSIDIENVPSVETISKKRFGHK